MTHHKQPENLTDSDLDAVQGGLGNHEIQRARAKTSLVGEKFNGIVAGSNATPLKHPGKNMEVVNEDE